MNIKGLKELNAKISRLTARQNNKLGDITRMVNDKNELLDEFVANNMNDIDSVLDDLESIRNNLYEDVYSLQKCKDVFYKYYTVAFNNAVTKTIETNLPHNSSRHGWGWGHGYNSNIWINRRGVATKGYSRTMTITSTENILNVLNDMKNLTSYIKKSRKELVRNVVNCGQKMKTIELNRKIYNGIIPDKIKYIITKEEYGTKVGIMDVKLGELEYLAINANNVKVEISIREKKDSYFWNSKSFSLTPNLPISHETKFILCQLPNDARQKINEFMEELNLMRNHNKKLLDKLTEQITPFMVMESL